MHSPPERLRAVQTDPQYRWVVVSISAAAGLGLASVHWLGLIAGGALVGVWWPTLRRALVAGLGFGVVVLAVAGARLALAGTLTEALATGPLAAIAVATALIGGPLGAAARGLFADAEGD